MFFEVSNKTRIRTKRIDRKDKTKVTDLWTEPSATPLSSSSSSSTASSAGGKEPGDGHRKDEIRQTEKKHGRSSRSSSARRSRSSSVSSASSKICSSSGEDHSGDRHCSGDSEYYNQQVIHPGWTFLYFLWQMFLYVRKLCS